MTKKAELSLSQTESERLIQKWTVICFKVGVSGLKWTVPGIKSGRSETKKVDNPGKVKRKNERSKLFGTTKK